MRPRFIVLCLALILGASDFAHAQPESWGGPERKGKKYSVTIDSAPQGATVYLETEEHGSVGITPVTLKLAAGNWKVILKKNGYENTTSSIAVKKSSKAQENFVPLIEADTSAVIEVTAEKDANVSGATVWLDGQVRGKAPTRLETVAGRHLVEVKKPGGQDYAEWVQLKEGQRLVVRPELVFEPAAVEEPAAPAPTPSAASLTVVSDVAGAVVAVNGKVVGKTPFSTSSLPAGNHTVSVRATGFPPKEEQVQLLPGVPLTVELNFSEIQASEPVVDTPSGPEEMSPPGAAPLEIKEPAALEPEEPVDEALVRRGLSSQGARPLPPKRSIIDLAVGYPYYINAGVMVGVGSIKDKFPVDAGVTVRSFFSRTELGLRARLQVLDADPVAFGVFAELGGGSNFVDKSSRNTFYTNLGAVASLTGLGMFTVSGRVYANLYSDRHCPEADLTTMQFSGGKPIDTCEKYLAGTLSAEDRQHIDEDLLDGPNDIFSRDSGMRLMTSVTVEIAVSERNNFWIMVEGAPFQDERAAFTHLFSGVMFDEDPTTYLAVGTTYKF